MREFQSRTASGVRGIRLQQGDEVISMSVLQRVGTNSEEREEYLKFAPWKPEKEGTCTLPEDRFALMAENEQFILTVTENGFGKRSSAYAYRRTHRGGQGITNINLKEEFGKRNGCVVASFPAKRGEQIMLVTDQAKLIRMSVADINVIGRGSAGSRLFRVGANEHVVSVAKIDESDEEEIELEGGEEISPVEDAITDADEHNRPVDPEPRSLGEE